MRKKYILVYFLLGFIQFTGFSQQNYELNSGWKTISMEEVAARGEEISNTSFAVDNWKDATVPGTILTTQLNNDEIPDPFFGMNNEEIPDIYDVGRDFYTYWFVKDFEEKAKKGEQVWLNFRGINYSVDIFLNGKKVNKEEYKGMFLRKRFNITKFLAKNGQNRLAVIVYPAPHVGNPNGGQGGDGTIARGVAHQYVAGWDWIQPIRDRNTGIWDKVIIEKTGAVNLKNPHVVTKVPEKRLPGEKQKPAKIAFTAEVENPTSKTVEGTLSFKIADQIIEKEVSLAANTEMLVALPEFEIEDPKLWWPSGYGAQNLYDAEVEFSIKNKTSDKEKLKVGIREIQTEWNSHTRSKQIFVNGQPIFIKGGNWIISDAMLRFTKERYDAEIRFHRDMNLNLIRIWGGALPERPEFYEACDKYGMLVIQDFWMSGDCNGRWVDPKKKDDQWTRRQYPDDHELFIESAADAVKLMRNHASLAIWCGGNEITPPQDILFAIKDSILPELDGTRWFIDYSNSDEMSYNFKGGNGDGPYGIQNISTFWEERTWPFNSEVGSVGTGDEVSLKRFLPKENYTVPVEYDGTEAVKDPVWTYHKYIDYGNSLEPYGTPEDMADFAEKAQLVNYNQYRALIEGFSAHMWDWYTGSIIWKTQNPWTALRGQMYDYYLDPNACLFGLREGSKPLHIMYNPVSSDVYMVNNGFKAEYDLMLGIKLYDMEGNEKPVTQVFSYIEGSSAKKILSLKKQIDTLAAEKGLFLKLDIRNKDQEVLDENFYWIPDISGTYSGLQNLAKTKVEAEIEKVAENKFMLKITNPENNTVSFFNRISLENSETGERILPTFYDDNYFSIVPGATREIILEAAGNEVNDLQISIEGWNTDRMLIPVN